MTDNHDRIAQHQRNVDLATSLLVDMVQRAALRAARPGVLFAEEHFDTAEGRLTLNAQRRDNVTALRWHLQPKGEAGRQVAVTEATSIATRHVAGGAGA